MSEPRRGGYETDLAGGDAHAKVGGVQAGLDGLVKREAHGGLRRTRGGSQEGMRGEVRAIETTRRRIVVHGSIHLYFTLTLAYLAYSSGLRLSALHVRERCLSVMYGKLPWGSTAVAGEPPRVMPRSCSMFLMPCT